ncbi:MAG: hypothetical protein ABSA57_08155 [Candidatus Acidiferrales bacterium]|jgi:hypothetical protein
MATAATSVRTEELYPGKPNSPAGDFKERLKRKFAGQHEAVQSIVDLQLVFCAQLDPSRSASLKPAVRPTGMGKARVVEAARRKC